MAEPPRQLTHSDYTVGWICALPETELVAAGAMLDEEHAVLPVADSKDTNSYLLGRIGTHNVVIACLPAQTTGKVSAATVAKDMVRSFKAVRFGLMVGIGGGAPYYGKKGDSGSQESDSDDDDNDVEDVQDIRLGDVVVSLHSKSSEAVVQYDFGKSVQGKEFVRAGGTLNKPPNIVLNAVSMIQGQHKRKGHMISEQISKMVLENPLMAGEFQSPGSSKDQLFKSDVVHVEGKKSCKSCHVSNDLSLVRRGERSGSSLCIHYGTIGSADQVMKDAILRDKWARKERILCFEMEAAGLMDSFPCLVIRGICDYADSHKNKIWQPYAAATAAAYAKELLMIIPGQRFQELPPIDLASTKIIHHLETWRRSEEQEKCLQAFRTSAYETQKDMNPNREARTCLWCLEDEKFLDWRDKGTSSLLWVTADPGCGKSVLSKALVDEHLLDSGRNDTAVCYFFFKDTSQEQRSSVAALAALLHQLFKSEAGARLIKHALPAFRQDEKKMSENLEIMWEIIQDIALDSNSGKIVFLLDALDECQSSEQQAFITKLKQLEDMQSSTSSVKNFKIFVTSRPYWNIEKGFERLIRDIPGIRLRGENQSKSLRLEIDYVAKARISRLGAQVASEQAREDLVAGLLKVENRTYLWLHLIFDFIESKPRIDKVAVRELLNTLPTTVEAVYDKLLQRSSDPEQARKLLNIVVAALRPLSTEEIGIALYITENCRSFEDLELQESHQLEITIRDLCGLFVSIVSGKVFLIHQTAKEFLLGQNDLEDSFQPVTGNWKHSLSIPESNSVLTYICIWYIRLKEFHRTDDFIQLEEVRGSVSMSDFLEYSARSWIKHFQAATVPAGSPLVALGLELCDVKDDLYKSWGHLYWRTDGLRKYHASKRPHFSASLGLSVVLGKMRGIPNADIGKGDNTGRTTLTFTVSNENGDMAGQLRALLNLGVNKADNDG